MRIISFTIRKARDADIEEVMRINVETLPENYWYGFYKHLLDNWGEAFLVAEAEGKLVGYSMSRVEQQSDPVLLGLAEEMGNEDLLQRILSSLRSIGDSRPVGHLVSIAVREPYRGMGIGSSLLSETLRVMKHVYRAESMYLEVRVSNERAIRLYERFGFRKARIIRGYYSDGEDAYVMVRRL